MSYDVKELESKMQKTIDNYNSELAVIRAGRANPELLNRINADYYGCPTPIPQMAQVSMPDPQEPQRPQRPHLHPLG